MQQSLIKKALLLLISSSTDTFHGQFGSQRMSMHCDAPPTTMICMYGQAQEEGEEVTNHNFIRQALQPLVSMLLEQLTKQEPGQDRDEGIWNISMAAGTCLGLVAQCVKDEIVSLVMPYVQVGIGALAASRIPHGHLYTGAQHACGCELNVACSCCLQ